MTDKPTHTPLPSKPRLDDWCDCPLHTLFPQRISELVKPTLLDLKAACDLIGKDTYGKPHWTPETIHPHNPVVQAFARHAVNSHHDLIEALREARTGLSITRTNVMTEIGRCADESRSPWAGVPEQLAKRIAKIDAILTKAEAGR